ncbi:Isopentenyl-diphosphate Delta-isomerase II [Trichinella nelsoni]|uniref:isopentenyl-diphosphate Delta-isomerase n=1 Tax=Trichinella nelsoni TaxID=6336 RepID=A0A0V0SKY5_9BILA|nr:Isopentenyl-diphosphate Delta-isomerase II [Trichinella nelsoni]
MLRSVKRLPWSVKPRFCHSSVNCVAVDRRDHCLGSISIEDAHNWKLIQDDVALHRAFSVFLFHSDGRMLIQKRASSKATFPGYWSNACCSHPRFMPDETNSDPPFSGIKCAAQRRMSEEFKIPLIPLESFHFIDRFIYKAQFNESLGEHELDYVFFVRSDLLIEPNFNEVELIQYVEEAQLKELLEFSDRKPEIMQFAPWFRLIAKKFLFLWWKHLATDMDELESIANTPAVEVMLVACIIIESISTNTTLVILERNFHVRKSQYWCPTINVEKIWSLIPETVRRQYSRSKSKAPVIDVVQSGYHKVLGKGKLPKQPVIVKAKFFSKRAEEKIKKVGGACLLVA